MAAPELEQLISLLSKLPSFGPRSARRVVLALLKQKESRFVPLVTAMQTVLDKVQLCPICGNMDTTVPCSICNDEKRDSTLVCVVQDVADLWALERAGVFKGVYHILGGVLSALDGVGPDELRIEELIEKVVSGRIKEVVLALPATVEGQTTVHYLSDKLSQLEVSVSTLSRGVPVGGELDYLDDGTLQLAFKTRRNV